jgi:hypothetical protein
MTNKDNEMPDQARSYSKLKRINMGKVRTYFVALAELGGPSRIYGM